jgi:hypothetical protein
MWDKGRVMKGKRRSEAQLELYEVMGIQIFAYGNETLGEVYIE